MNPSRQFADIEASSEEESNVIRPFACIDVETDKQRQTGNLEAALDTCPKWPVPAHGKRSIRTIGQGLGTDAPGNLGTAFVICKCSFAKFEIFIMAQHRVQIPNGLWRRTRGRLPELSNASAKPMKVVKIITAKTGSFRCRIASGNCLQSRFRNWRNKQCVGLAAYALFSNDDWDVCANL